MRISIRTRVMRLMSEHTRTHMEDLLARDLARWLAAPMGRHQPPYRGVGLAPAVMLGIGHRI